jgi:hypothetical protein
MPVNIDLNDVMQNHPLITDFKPLPSRPLIMAAAQQQPPPSNQGPVINIVPVIDILGGFTGGTRHHDPRRPPGRQPPTNSDHNTDNGPVTNQSPTKPPGTTRSPGATKSPAPTQPPVITRTVPATVPTQKYQKPKSTPTPAPIR